MLAHKAKKWPGAAILMEFSMTIHMHQATLSPAFVRRESNDWADQLSKLNPDGFCPEKRIEGVLGYKMFIMNKILALADTDPNLSTAS
jgi:hypothetical protein